MMEGSVSKMIEYVMDGRINKISGCIMDGSTNVMNLMLGVSLSFMILNKYFVAVLTTLITLAISRDKFIDQNIYLEKLKHYKHANKLQLL